MSPVVRLPIQQNVNVGIHQTKTTWTHSRCREACDLHFCTSEHYRGFRLTVFHSCCTHTHTPQSRRTSRHPQVHFICLQCRRSNSVQFATKPARHTIGARQRRHVLNGITSTMEKADRVAVHYLVTSSTYAGSKMWTNCISKFCQPALHLWGCVCVSFLSTWVKRVLPTLVLTAQRDAPHLKSGQRCFSECVDMVPRRGNHVPADRHGSPLRCRD